MKKLRNIEEVEAYLKEIENHKTHTCYGDDLSFLDELDKDIEKMKGEK